MFFRERVSIALHKSRQNRAEQPSLVIYEALSCMLMGSGSPLTAQLQVCVCVRERESERVRECLSVCGGGWPHTAARTHTHNS